MKAKRRKPTTLPNPCVATIGNSQETVRETSDTCIFGLALWCRDYHNRTAYPCTPLQRFVIAHYQLSQGIKWNDNPTAYREYESFAASALHFLMVGHCFELDVADLVADKLLELDSVIFSIKKFPTKAIDYKLLTVTMSAAAQQVFYAEKTFKQGYTRKSRYNPEVLRKLLANLVVMLISSIPTDQREEAIEQASSIMTKRL